MSAPAFLAISHGTSSPEGAAAVADYVDAIAAAAAGRFPGALVAGGFVDVQQPDVPNVLGGLDESAEAVVVPLLLSAGYHVRVDLRRDLDAERRPSALAGALGPDHRLIDVLVRRLHEAGLRRDDVVVLAAAGSSDAHAVEDCRVVAQHLGLRLRRPVSVGFISAATPALPDAVAAARAARPGARVVVATYLLAPGYFAGLAEDAGGDVTSAPLLTVGAPVPPELVAVALDRYQEASVRVAQPVRERALA
ncbi:CbiX/SirB N-terminal domain-containing protein [Agromyces seonyuensis]|uniref:Cobalamin biosynthesis protein CbiX n=1 Tax=Agromyces seonyuensis TaxID=2662446 RepID=A0A6I4P4N7_9MICO|nr:cobalamin biosynthesis protein CbiX [Agromyces seonyuensis]